MSRNDKLTKAQQLGLNAGALILGTACALGITTGTTSCGAASIDWGTVILNGEVDGEKSKLKWDTNRNKWYYEQNGARVYVDIDDLFGKKVKNDPLEKNLKTEIAQIVDQHKDNPKTLPTTIAAEVEAHNALIDQQEQNSNNLRRGNSRA